MPDDQASEFEGWAVLELMGHRKLAGYVRTATIAGAGVLRIDVPKPLDLPQDEPASTRDRARDGFTATLRLLGRACDSGA